MLINLNSSVATSDMMQAIALRAATGRLAVKVVTADRSPPMIVTPEALADSAAQVVEFGTTHGTRLCRDHKTMSDVKSFLQIARGLKPYTWQWVSSISSRLTKLRLRGSGAT